MTNVLEPGDNGEKEADDSLWQGSQDLWDLTVAHLQK